MIPRRKLVRFAGAADMTHRIEVQGVPGLPEHRARIAVLHYAKSTTFVNLESVATITVVDPNTSALHGRRVVLALHSGAWHEVEYAQPDTDEDTDAQLAEIDALMVAWQTAISAT